MKDDNTTKVLFAISNIAIGGGAEKVATTIANEFLARGVATTLLTYYSADAEHVFNGEHISLKEPERHSLLGKLFRAPHRLWSIKKVCSEKDVDIVLSFLEESNYYTLISKLLLFNRTRMIVSVRNDPRYYPWPYRMLICILYPFAEKVVAVTKGVENILREDFGLTNTTTIYNPINMSEVAKKIQAGLPHGYKWLTDRHPLFVTVGRCVRQKGQWHLIRAFTEVIRRYPNATLVVVGEGPYKEAFLRYVRAQNLEKNIFFLDRQENIYPFLKIADTFVLPSLWEGMPNILLEAASVGCRLVATDASTGAREILAPKLPLTEKILYPYHATYGTLIRPFPAEGNFEESLSSRTLSPEETQLAEAMVSISADTKKAGVSFTKDPRFMLDNITAEWLAVL